MGINFRDNRKLFWIPNYFLFNFTKLVTKLIRNRRIWLFGALAGKKYEDNSMHLFEYINQLNSDIRPIWITCNEQVVKMIRSKGYEVYSTKSMKGQLFSLYAGVAFYTNGLDDFGQFPLIGGAKIVSLWHGVGFKKLYNETYSGQSLNIKRILDFFFSWTYRNISIATSDYSKKKTIHQFGLKEKDVYITGQPRNDIFKENISKEETFCGIKIPDDKKLLLYMPTYRCTSQGKDVVPSIIEDLYNSRELATFLDQNNFLFLAKLHPKTTITKYISTSSFIILKDENVISSQKLIAISDLMLTDYSSCFIDFALLNRPIFFYTPDIKEYLESATGLDDSFFSITSQNRSNSIKELCTLLESWKDNNILKQTYIINNLFEDSSITNTNYSKNVYLKIREILKI